MGGGKFLKILINWGGVKNKCGGGNFLKNFQYNRTHMLCSLIFGGKFKMYVHNCKVLAEHLLFLLWPVIQYQTWKMKKWGEGSY